jgi:hypothetical protein
MIRLGNKYLGKWEVHSRNYYFVLKCHYDRVWDITCEYSDIRSVFIILRKNMKCDEFI